MSLASESLSLPYERTLVLSEDEKGGGVVVREEVQGERTLVLSEREGGKGVARGIGGGKRDVCDDEENGGGAGESEQARCVGEEDGVELE